MVWTFRETLNDRGDFATAPAMNLRHLENRALTYLAIAIVIALALWLFT